jgi:hypothetical protein
MSTFARMYPSYEPWFRFCMQFKEFGMFKLWHRVDRAQDRKAVLTVGLNVVPSHKLFDRRSRVEIRLSTHCIGPLRLQTFKQQSPMAGVVKRAGPFRDPAWLQP